MRYRTFSIIIVLLLVPLSIENSLAQNDQIEEDAELESTESETIVYNVGVNLVGVGNIDRESGSSDLIFWWTIVSDDIDFTKYPPPEDWDLTNGYVVDKTGQYTDTHFYKVKMRGAFFNEIDFRNYPYDEITLAIHIEPYLPLTADKIEFRVNEQYSVIDPHTVSVPGWTIGEPSFATYTTTHPWGDFTHYEAHFPIVTNPLDVFIKKILPVLVLASFGFGTLFMSSNQLQIRTGIIGTCIAGALFFHAVFLLGELPPLSYLTLADKIMISIYSVFAMAVLASIFHQRHLDTTEITHDKRDIQRQFRIDKKMMILTPIVALAIFALLYSL